MISDNKVYEDVGDNGDRVMVVTGGDQDLRATDLIREIERSGVQGVRIITADSLGTPDLSQLKRDPHRTRTVHKTTSVGASVIGMAAALGISLDGFEPTGTMRSNMRRRQHEARQPTTQQDLDRLAAAEAKRARKAQKRSSK